MKPYGIPRNKDVECPDVVDIKTYGLKTSIGGKDYFRNKESKRAIRRVWKRKARREGKILLQEERVFGLVS